MNDRDKEKACAINANRSIEAVEELSRSKGFAWFCAKLREMADSMADTILSADMPHDEREKMRQRRLQILDILQLPSSEASAAESLLRHHRDRSESY